MKKSINCPYCIQSLTLEEIQNWTDSILISKAEFELIKQKAGEIELELKRFYTVDTSAALILELENAIKPTEDLNSILAQVEGVEKGEGKRLQKYQYTGCPSEICNDLNCITHNK